MPKKSALRHLAEFCTDDIEKRRLLELSSREGADDYLKFIRNTQTNFIDVLSEFTSCKPSIEAILVNISCFVPRYYSVANSPDSKCSTAKFALSVIDIDAIYGRSGSRLNGLFTGLINREFNC